MATIEITSLSSREKLQLMEALWDDMRQKAGESVIPKDHQKILEARWVRVQSGETELLEWDDIKETIGRP
jgi:putative addiction module component (TIGR02574 family)